MHKLWKIYRYIAVFIFTLFLVDAVVVIGFSIYRPFIPKTDAIIILGAAINTPALTNRSLEGLKLYQQGKGDVLMLSGGRISDADISEAGYMKKVILRTVNDNSKNNNSLPEANPPTILDEDSHNTYENIKNSKRDLPNAKSIIIVSDSFHLARAVLVAKRAGFAHVYWSSPKPYYYKKSELVFYYIRELVAMVEYIPKFVTN